MGTNAERTKCALACPNARPRGQMCTERQNACARAQMHAELQNTHAHNDPFGLLRIYASQSKGYSRQSLEGVFDKSKYALKRTSNFGANHLKILNFILSY